MSRRGTIQLERVFPRAPATVWRAISQPEGLAQWWAAGDIRPVVGHRFDLDMGAWGKQPCEVLEVVPERLLRYRFSAGRLDTVLTFQLEPEGSGTRLKFTHDEFDLDSPEGQRAYDGMKQGWPGVLGRLEKAVTA